jgi:DNA-binding PucR family transcriptional regulator
MRLLVELGTQEGMQGTVELDDFLPEMLLARSPRVGRRLSRRVMGPLEEYAEKRSTDLIETVEAFVKSGQDRRATAKLLHVHPNTLDYRLRRIGELTGLDTSKPDDLMLLALALKQRRLPRYL